MSEILLNFLLLRIFLLILSLEIRILCIVREIIRPIVFVRFLMKNCLKNFRYLLNLEDDGFEEVEQDFLFELLTLDVRIDLVELRFLFEQLVLDVRINLVELVK